MKGLIRDRLGERIDLLRRLMKSRGVDAAIAMARDGYNWETCYHLSGFRGSSCALVVFRD
ncbi:MAG TPA: peptidase M24, partial [Synergistaceae bacterium]|nr:peptidase M24 [Synergistaceae bacterium]